jgi:hypothetical protein
MKRAFGFELFSYLKFMNPGRGSDFVFPVLPLGCGREGSIGFGAGGVLALTFVPEMYSPSLH